MLRPPCLAKPGQATNCLAKPGVAFQSFLRALPVRCVLNKVTCTRRVLFPAITRWQAHIGTYFHQMASNKHASSIISSDYPMTSTHRDVFPSNAQQQARIGYYFQRLPDAKHTSGRISIKCPKTSTHRVMFQAVTRQQERIGSCFQRLPKECSRRVPKWLA